MKHEPLTQTHTQYRPIGNRLRWGIVIAGIVGIVIWWTWFGSHWDAFLTLGMAGDVGLLWLAIGSAVAVLMPSVRHVLDAFVKWARYPTLKTRQVVAIIVGVLATGYLIATALAQHRALYPVVHDEFSYLIGAHQLALGRLWMPAHPLAPFFDSFQLIVNPVYASAYFPGTAMLFAIAIITHIPPWLWAAIMAGVVAGLFYWIVTDLMDGTAGLLAVLLLLSTGMYRTLSIMVMAQIPLMLAGLVAVVAWLKWDRNRRGRWALCMGAALGWAAIIRPVDALCYAIPIGVAFIWARVRSRRQWDTDFRAKIRRSLGLVILGMIPFLAIQLVSNRGITGQWFETPFRYYADRDYPLTSFGFHQFDPSARPASHLPQKQALYFGQYVPQIRQHTPANAARQWWRFRLREALTFASPFPFPTLLLLLPLGLVIARNRAWVLLATLPLFVGLYALYVFYFPHYSIVIAPAVIVGILLGARALPMLIGRGENLIGMWCSLMILGIGIAALPQWDPQSDDAMFNAPLIKAVHEKLAQLRHASEPGAIVLFQYDPARNVNEEPVYNADVAWPDHARVIRANDLGAKDSVLFRYYADRQPDRAIYRFDERDDSLHYLGTARQLAGISPTDRAHYNHR